ncbi:uncharacterized protein LOC143032692 [Oratosquilla oratoria]|uniref:uncharacterized protein LOC143032692 n=1 Tax=Oratosquilla oratoria TaxID=337810 RepID=UPI003F7717E5
MPPTEDPCQGTGLPSYDLLAATGTPIATYGSYYSVLDLQNGKFPWTFVITDVRQPILGYDFLQYYKMTVSAKDNCLYHATRRIPGTTTNATSKVSSLQPAGEYTRILQDFPQLTSPCKATTTRPPQHCVSHPNSWPAGLQQASTPLPRKVGHRQTRVSKTFLTKTSSAHLRVLRHRHMVPKTPPPNEWRACSDYRQLKLITKADRYPIPHSQDFHFKLYGKQVFPKIDLLRRSTRFLWHRPA